MPFLTQARKVAEFEAQRGEIEKACQIMDAHSGEFEKLLEDETAFFERAETIFSEARFTGMRFSGDDVQRAFEAVGYPPQNDFGEKYAKIVAKAICFLVTPTHGTTLSLKLLLMIPDYVAEGRFADAWVIKHCVDATAEFSEDSVGPFLMTMFLAGLREWDFKREQEQLALFEKIGLKPEDFHKMGYDGLEKMIQEMAQNPEKTQVLEKFLANHPELNDMTQAQCHSAEDAAVKLLGREDAKVLFLSLDETAPWFGPLEQRLSKVAEKFPIPQKLQPNEKAIEAFMCALFDVADEMVKEVFTAPRLEKLRMQLLEYREGFSKDDDPDAIDGINGALLMVQTREEVTDNRFLTSLCAYSLRAGVKTEVSEYEEDEK